MQTLDGLDIVMKNNDERRDTVLVFLSSRCETTEKNIEEIRTFCQNRGVIFPVYRDVGAAIAKRFDVKVTPGALILDKNGTVAAPG